MRMSGKYCCFKCPRSDFSVRRLTDRCPYCGRPYDFPLKHAPAHLARFRLSKPLGLGFYGAIFLAGSNSDPSQQFVLKIIPKSTYDFFGKDFYRECFYHKQLSAASSVAVPIVECFDTVADFGGDGIECHVMVMPYLGELGLADALAGKSQLNWRQLAMISAELLRFLQALSDAKLFHNDLHADNILIRRIRHGDHSGEDCKPIVIDFGSMSEKSRSGASHRSDLEWSGDHIRSISRVIHQAYGDRSLLGELQTCLVETADRLAAIQGGLPGLGFLEMADRLDVNVEKTALTARMAPDQQFDA